MLEIPTPHGPARVHLDPGDAPPTALVLTALGALAIVNSFGVRKQNAAAAAHSAALRNPPGA